MPLMAASSDATACADTLEKSVPFGYHRLTIRLQFSTDPFSHAA
jgi:hypothetical protein